MPYAYRKSERLRKNSEFASLMKQGKRLSTDGLSLFYAPNGGRGVRLGISVGKKLSHAVERNRLRRRIRAAAASGLAASAEGFDIVFMARQSLMQADFDRIKEAVLDLLNRSVLRNKAAREGSAR